MDNKQTVIDTITESVENERISDIDEITVRECSSENYDGISINITGYIVPIRPILESIISIPDWKIEDIGMYGDIPVENEEEDDNTEIEYTHGVTLFCAYTGENSRSDIFT